MKNLKINNPLLLPATISFMVGRTAPIQFAPILADFVQKYPTIVNTIIQYLLIVIVLAVINALTNRKPPTNGDCLT